MLRDTFIALCGKFTSNSTLIGQLWAEIETQYSDSHRHYHNLDHLSNMHFHLQACRHMVMDWDSMVFALFYHDFVYNATSKNNEENSAVEAEKRLTALRLPIDKIAQVVQLIDATKSHKVSSDNDVNLFTDSDLSILGSPQAEYELYCSNVRKEYSIFPDILYKPGRRKVLRHFLDMPYIFKTDFFRSKLESIARQNIKTELNKLI